LHFGITFAIIICGECQKYSGGINMNRFFREEEGQGLVEYALIIGLIAIVAIAALSAAGTSVSGLFGNINDKLSTANQGNGVNP
jgi:pilus assembly protein Flp/PilA